MTQIAKLTVKYCLRDGAIIQYRYFLIDTDSTLSTEKG